MPTRDADSGVNSGLFQVAHELLETDRLSDLDRGALLEALAWFNTNLPEPDRFNRTTSKGHYRRAATGIAWFRDTAFECIQRMHILAALLDAHGHPVSIIRESRVGYVVYEDPHQVVAEPFADTRTTGR